MPNDENDQTPATFSIADLHRSYSIRETAWILGTSRSEVYHWIKTGFFQSGTVFRVDRGKDSPRVRITDLGVWDAMNTVVEKLPMNEPHHSQMGLTWHEYRDRVWEAMSSRLRSLRYPPRPIS